MCKHSYGEFFNYFDDEKNQLLFKAPPNVSIIVKVIKGGKARVGSSVEDNTNQASSGPSYPTLDVGSRQERPLSGFS
jgi:hypothetical protein